MLCKVRDKYFYQIFKTSVLLFIRPRPNFFLILESYILHIMLYIHIQIVCVCCLICIINCDSR